MLSDDEKSDIDHEITKFPVRKSACLEALMVVQKYRGFVSDESLQAVAHYLGMSPAELDGIATFYNLIYRKPVGKKVIRLCDSVSCWLMGYEAIYQHIKKELAIDWGETSADNEFTLLPAQCLGACDRAPCMMVNDKTYFNLSPKLISKILESHAEEESHDKASYSIHESGWSSP
jgi:NADH-quinone oxidoreductase subunit E